MGAAAGTLGVDAATVAAVLRVVSASYRQLLADEVAARRAARLEDSCGGFYDHEPHDHPGGWCYGNGPFRRTPCMENRSVGWGCAPGCGCGCSRCQEYCASAEVENPALMA